MKLLRKLTVFALLFAMVAVIMGFTVLSAPKTADAVSCECSVRVCLVDNPRICWCVCVPCPPPPGPFEP